jgi:hypothetical protein
MPIRAKPLVLQFAGTVEAGASAEPEPGPTSLMATTTAAIR